MIEKIKPDLVAHVKSFDERYEVIVHRDISIDETGILFYAYGWFPQFRETNFFLPWKHFNIDR